MFKFGKSTAELFTELKTEKNPDDWRKKNINEFVTPLNEYLQRLLVEKTWSVRKLLKNLV